MKWLAAQVGRTTALIAGISTGSALWLWVLTGHSATGTWFAVTPALLLVLPLLLIPAAVLWFFYVGIRSVLGLPEEVRRLVEEGRLRSGDLATAFRGAGVPERGMTRVWSIFRSVLELRNLVFRSKGLLLAAGMVIRLRIFNPAFLLALLLSLLATAAITLAALGGTVLMALGA